MKVRAFERYIPLKEFAKQIIHIKTRRETFVILVSISLYWPLTFLPRVRCDECDHICITFVKQV